MPSLTPMTNSMLIDFAARIEQAIELNPAYGDELLLIDVFDREGFESVSETVIDAQDWVDFVDFCSHETVPWLEWFERWRDAGKEVG